MFLILLNLLAPHITSEMYELIYNDNIIDATWPIYDIIYLKLDSYELVIQINGKKRHKQIVEMNSPEEEITTLALSNERIKELIGNREIKKVIYVKNKLVNIII